MLNSLRPAIQLMRRRTPGLRTSLNRRRLKNQPPSLLKRPRSDQLPPKRPWPQTADECAAHARAGVLLRGCLPWRATNQQTNTGRSNPSGCGSAQKMQNRGLGAMGAAEQALRPGEEVAAEELPDRPVEEMVGAEELPVEELRV